MGSQARCCARGLSETKGSDRAAYTGFAISFEGIYKWVAFVHSKSSKHIPVPNRYFGVFEDDGSLKVRGLEIRRRDNPPFFDKFQAEVLQVIAKGNTIEEVRMMMMPQVKDVFNKYVQLLKDRRFRFKNLSLQSSCPKILTAMWSILSKGLHYAN